MVVEQMGPAWFMEPSTFLMGRGEWSMCLCCLAKLWLMIIPFVPLLRKARALIFHCDFRPTRKTLNVIEGDLILQMILRGTEEESTVSKKDMLCISKGLGTRRVLQDSAAAGQTRNPGLKSRGRDERGQSGVWVLGKCKRWTGPGR